MAADGMGGKIKAGGLMKASARAKLFFAAPFFLFAVLIADSVAVIPVIEELGAVCL